MPRRILFVPTDFNELPYPPEGFKYIGFDGDTFSEMSDNGQVLSGTVGPTGPTGPGGGGTSSSDRLISSNNLEVVLDNHGTINTPLLLPISFTAVCDADHFDGTPSFSGSDWWEFEVHFEVNPDGTVETMINNIFPILTNPGYVSGNVFIFTEEDHGIPGFNFELQLNDVVLPGGAGWTSNLSVTQPPVYPSTIESLGALKFTSNSNSLVLSTNGDLILPGGMEVGGVSLSIDGSDTILEKRLEETETDGIVTVTNAVGSKLTFNYNSIGMESYLDPDGPNNTSLSRVLVGPGAVEILSSEENVGGDATTGILVGGGGIQISTNDGVTTQTITVGGGVINLPEGGDIKDYLGNSVLSGVSLTQVTHSEILDMIDSSTLIPGRFYEITDYKTCYDQPDYDYNGNAITEGNYKVGPTQPVVVWSLSSNSLSVDAWQPDYPNDKIKYDVSWTQSEITGGTAYGRIIERIDENNNRTDYDHRNVKFKRYRSRFLDGTVGGRITSMNDGLITGTGTSFLGDFGTGSVVFLESLNPNFYKVTDIISDTQMTVAGVSYDNFDYPIGYRLQQTYLEQNYTPGGLYYFNDTGVNCIYDGGNDMYDTGNYLNTNLQNQIPYTHTQMVGIEGQAVLENFTYDGVVEVGDSYFGEGSSYFTNTYPGLFVMSAYDVSVTDFSITGDIGADGGGYVEVAEYTWEGFKIFVKKVFGAGDPSINHIIIVNSTDELIERTYNADSGADNTTGDVHELANLDNVTQIHYLLFGLAGGIKPTDTQIENVYQTYLNMIDNMSISNTLTTLNSDFTDITDNLPPNSTMFSSLRVRQSNVVEDNSFYREILTFDEGITARNNYIGNSCDSWEWDERDFMLPNNVFTNAYGNFIDVYDNYFGDRCVDNTFGDDVYENVVGSDFRRNMCEDRFDRNQIGSNFYNNEFYATEFESNIVGENFNNNTIIQDYNDVYDNNIGNDFGDNIFYSESRFYRNRVGLSFFNNRINDDMYNNDIGNDFVNNDIYRQFYKNRIGNYFGSNDIYNNFYDNQIDNGFDSNTIGLSSNIGGYEFYKNKIGVTVKGNLFTAETKNNIIGDNFSSNETGNYFNRNVFGIECIENTIGENFEDNNIGNYFSGNNIVNYFTNNVIGNNFNNNNILNNFALNNIGNNFQENTIENDFGFGGAQAYGNRIGNYFQYNEIGEYFYNNDIRDVFDNNTVGNYFRNNSIQVQNLSGNNFNTNYGNIITFTDNTGASPSIPGTDGTYTALTAHSDEGGYNANFNVVVSGSVVTSVTLNASGFEYSISDNLTILGTDFGGTTESNITITVASVSVTPSVYGDYNTTIFKNSFGDNRLSYYDENDVLTITNLNE